MTALPDIAISIRQQWAWAIILAACVPAVDRQLRKECA